jgi:hypothetical protein
VLLLLLLQGESYPLRLGYFVVINPSQQDLNNNMTAVEAATKEAKFFKTDAFFSGDPRVSRSVRDRFGVDALRVQLSRQLVQLTQRELPGMKHALEHVLTEVSAPPAPAAAQSYCSSNRIRQSMQQQQYTPATFCNVRHQ